MEEYRKYTDLKEALKNPEAVEYFEYPAPDRGVYLMEKSISKLKNLKKLVLHSWGFVDQFPEALCNLTALEHLDLSHCSADLIPDSIGKLTNLKTLILYSNGVEYVSPELMKLTQLEVLDLSYCSVSKLPPGWKNLSRLRELRLEHNRLTALPEDLGEATQLEVLALKENQLTGLPNMGNLFSLRSLELYDNQLKELPPSICNCWRLEELDLSVNQLEKLWGEPAFPRLRKLIVSVNQLEDFPQEILELNNLETLDLSENGPMIIPQEIDRLKSLEELELIDAAESIPDSISNLQKLNTLGLGGLDLKKHKINWQSLDSLTSLTIMRGEIEEINSAVLGLKHLRSIEFSYNPLGSVPQDLELLVNLETIFFPGCNLREFPDIFSSLPSIQRLGLLENELTALPPSFWEVTTWTSVYLEDNNFDDAYKERLEAHFAALRNQTGRKIVLEL